MSASEVICECDKDCRNLNNPCTVRPRRALQLVSRMRDIITLHK